MDLSSLSDEQLRAIAGDSALSSVSQAILGQESGGRLNIGNSPNGAVGVGQIMPSTFKQYAREGEDINNPADNLAVHNRIIEDLSNKFNGDPARIAVGYFSGPGNVAPPDSPTPWKNDRKDAGGKSVSSYVADILGRVGDTIIPSAQASDLSGMSDEQLKKIAGTPDYSGLGAFPWSKANSSGVETSPLADILQKTQTSNKLPTYGAAYMPELSDAYIGGIENQVGGLKNVMNAFSPISALARMSMGEMPTPEQAAYLTNGSPLSPLKDLSKGLGKGALGTLSEIFSPITAANRAFVGNPLQNATGIPSGLTDAVLSLIEPSAVGKVINMLGKSEAATNALGKVAELFGGDVNATKAPYLDLGGKPVEDAAKATQAATDVSKAAPTAAAKLSSSNPEAFAETVANRKQAAGGIYEQMKSEGATFKPESLQGLSKAVGEAVDSKGFIPELNPKTMAIVNKIQKVAEKGDMSVGELDQYRRLLSRVGGSEDGVSAGAVRSAIDHFVNNSTGNDLVNGSTKAIELLNQARGDYAKASLLEDFSDILTKTGGDVKKMQKAIGSYLNKTGGRGLTKEQLALFKTASKSGTAQNLLNALGSFGFDLGLHKNVVVPAITAMTGVGTPLAAAGTIARPLANAIGRRSIDKALNAIAK